MRGGGGSRCSRQCLGWRLGGYRHQGGAWGRGLSRGVGAIVRAVVEHAEVESPDLQNVLVGLCEGWMGWSGMGWGKMVKDEVVRGLVDKRSGADPAAPSKSRTPRDAANSRQRTQRAGRGALFTNTTARCAASSAECFLAANSHSVVLLYEY